MLQLALMVMSVWSLAAGQNSTPRPCCINHQFTAGIGERGQTVHNGHGVYLEGTVRVTYDYDAKVMGLFTHIMTGDSGTFTDTKVVQDFNTHTQYLIMANGDCFTEPLHGDIINPCIPANASFLITLAMGSGSHVLKTNVWTFTVPAAHVNEGSVIVHLAVQEDDCTPVVEEMHGRITGNDDSDIFYFFTNFMPSITDRSPLVIPAAATCRPLPNSDSGLVGR